MEHPQGIGWKEKCEPEAAASKDSAHPHLCSPWLKGDNLYATDSYVAVRIPVKRDDGDMDGEVPRAALKVARSKKPFVVRPISGTDERVGLIMPVRIR